MIIDITGTKLTPGNMGRDCRGNGSYYNKKGKLIECCCDECDYYMCCIEEHNENNCKTCEYFFCPRIKNKFGSFFRFLKGWYEHTWDILKEKMQG